MLGRAVAPTLPKKTAAECGLAGQAGLTIDDSPLPAEVAAAAAAAAEAAAPAFELVVIFDWPLVCKTLKKDAMAAKAAVLALSLEAAVQLQATLDADGEAEVGGFKIGAAMVRAAMVEKAPTGSMSRNSSVASSLDSKMPRTASATSIATSTDSASSSQMPSRNDSALDLQAAAAETGAASAATRIRRRRR